MISMSVLGPKNWGKIIPHQQIDQAIQNALAASGLGVQADFDVTTQTWKHDVKVEIIKEGKYKIRVVINDKIFKLVNFGTSAHWIHPKGKRLRFQTGYRPKTRPNGRIQSYSGGKSGPFVFARAVRHPGTSGRRFDAIIRRKWQKQFPLQLRRAINAAIRSARGRH